jgi:hypothetical protein
MSPKFWQDCARDSGCLPGDRVLALLLILTCLCLLLLLLSPGTCTGGSQFPCKSSMPGDGCGSSQPPSQINVGGIGNAPGSSGNVAQEAGAKAAAFGRADLAAARVAQNSQKTAQKGGQCGDAQKPWGDTKCADGLQCKKQGNVHRCA